MNTSSNRQIIQQVFDELAKGNGRPFSDCMAEDCCWTLTGSTPWSRSFRGKQAIRQELLKPLFENFADAYTGEVKRILADGDFVVVEWRGRVTTREGKPYHNAYCYVIRMADGKMQELIEYWDTALAEAVLKYPESQQVA